MTILQVVTDVASSTPLQFDWSGIVTTLIGLVSGGGLMWLFTLKSIQKSAEADAKTKEAEAATSEVKTVSDVQSVYQETIIDLREDKRLLKDENILLKDENKNQRAELSELRDICDKNSKDIRELKLMYMKDKCLKEDCVNRITA